MSARTGTATIELPRFDEDPDAPFALPRLTLASRPARRQKPRIAYAAVVIVGVFAIVAGQLLLSIALSDGAYEISSLQAQKRDLDRTSQSLTEQVEKLASPQNLATGAESLGMVSNLTPVYLRLSDGAVLGDPTPAATSAGRAVGGHSLVPNAALAAPAPQIAATPAAPAPAAAAPTVPWQGVLPAPATR